MSKRRVVITGLGLISPCGDSVAEGWSHVRDGVSGITAIDQFDASAFSTRFAGTIRNFQLDKYLDAKEARKCDPFIHYGIASCIQAYDDAGIKVDPAQAHAHFRRLVLGGLPARACAPFLVAGATGASADNGEG